MDSLGDTDRRTTIGLITLSVAIALVCVACGSRGVTPSSAIAAPATDACGELTSARILVELHHARRTGTALEPETLTCLRGLPGAPVDLDERLAIWLDGERGTLEPVRHGLAVRDGSLQIHLAALERDAAQLQDAGLWLELGELLERVGRLDEAEVALEAAAALAADDVWIAAAQVALGETVGNGDPRLDAIAFSDTLTDTAMTWSLRTSRARPDGLARFALHARTVACATSAATRHPDSQAARLRLVGLLTGDVRRWDDAVAWLSAAPEAGVRLRVAEARLRWRMGDRDGAVERARALASELPDAPDIIALQAGLARSMGLRNEAGRADAVHARLLRERAERLSDDPGVQLELALAAFRSASGGDDEALSAARHAVRMAPGLSSALLVTGHLARAAGHDAEADEAFEALDALLAERAEGAVGAGPAVRLATHRLEALDAPGRALEALEGIETDDATVWLARCRAREHLDALDAALEACEVATRRAPGWLAPRLRLVELERAREPGAEVGRLRDVLALDPEQSLSRRRLVELLLQRGASREAARVMTEPIRWAGPGADTIDGVVRRLALGEMPVLAGHLRRWVLTPWLSQSPEHWSLLADAAIARGAWGEASQAASREAELGGDARSLVALSAAALEAGESRVGLRALEVAMTTVPEARGEMFRALAQAARNAGREVLSDWARCRIRDGAPCGRPPTNGGGPSKR